MASRAETMARDNGKPWSGQSVEAIQQFLDTLATVQAEFPKFHLSPGEFWGKTEEQIRAIATPAAARYAKRAGVRGLVKKYGHEAASDIVFKHSGRRIR